MLLLLLLLLLLVVLTLPAPCVLLPSADGGAEEVGRKLTRFPSTVVDEEDDEGPANMSWYDADPDGPSTRKGAFGGGTTAGAMMMVPFSFCASSRKGIQEYMYIVHHVV